MLGPFDDRFDFLGLAGRVEQAVVDRRAQTTLAQVVLLAEHRFGAQVSTEGLFEQGNVFLDELILQDFGEGRDHDFAFAGERPVRSRHQVGQALADAGAGLDDQVLRPGERVPHGLGHLNLLRACLEVGEDLSQPAIRAEHFGQA